MMKAKAFGVMVAIVLSAGFGLADGQGVRGKKGTQPGETTRAEKSRGGGPDSNVKQDRQAVTAADKPTAAPAPPNKASARGERSRQAGLCQITVDNWTGFGIDIFVDGTYRGTVAAWGGGYTYAEPGSTALYARSAGGTVYWGPRQIDCRSTYVWKLTQ